MKPILDYRFARTEGRAPEPLPQSGRASARRRLALRFVAGHDEQFAAAPMPGLALYNRGVLRSEAGHCLDQFIYGLAKPPDGVYEFLFGKAFLLAPPGVGQGIS